MHEVERLDSRKITVRGRPVITEPFNVRFHDKLGRLTDRFSVDIRTRTEQEIYDEVKDSNTSRVVKEGRTVIPAFRTVTIGSDRFLESFEGEGDAAFSRGTGGLTRAATHEGTVATRRRFLGLGSVGLGGLLAVIDTGYQAVAHSDSPKYALPSFLAGVAGAIWSFRSARRHSQVEAHLQRGVTAVNAVKPHVRAK